MTKVGMFISFDSLNSSGSANWSGRLPADHTTVSETAGARVEK
jgi:hypothetical protein